MPDDATPNAEGQTSGADGQTDGNASGGGNDDAGNNGETVYRTQADFDAAMTKRLRRERRRIRDEVRAELATQNDDQGGQAGQNVDADQIRREATAEADARVESAQRLAVNAHAMIAASAASVRPERVQAVVNLAGLDLAEVIDDQTGEIDEDAIKATVNETVAAYPEFKVATSAPATDQGEGKPAPVGGKTPKPDGDKPENAVTAEDFAKMGYTERVQLRQRDPELYTRLVMAVA